MLRYQRIRSSDDVPDTPLAGDEEAVFQIAMNAESATEFERAVQLLGAMGAADKLRQLSSRPGDKSTLINAYAVSGDVESLRRIAAESDNPEEQHAAIRAMGIVGGSAVNDTLVQIYKESDSDEVKSAALEGLMVSGYDEGVIELYRASSDNNEKRELLRMLTTMGSDEVWTLIDDALGSDQ